MNFSKTAKPDLLYAGFAGKVPHYFITTIPERRELNSDGLKGQIQAVSIATMYPFHDETIRILLKPIIIMGGPNC